MMYCDLMSNKDSCNDSPKADDTSEVSMCCLTILYISEIIL